MLNLFGPKSARVMGIDLTSTTVKLLELSKVGTNYQVESFAVVPFAAEAVAEREIKDQTAVTEAIRIAVQRSHTAATHVVLGVPTSAVITKTLQFSIELSEDELEDQVELEATKLTPYSGDDIALDFATLGLSKTNPSMNDVLVVACRRDYIDSRVDVVRDAGLEVTIVDVEAFAAERAYRLIEQRAGNVLKGEIIAIVDIGASMTSLTVISNQLIIYTREEVFGGRHLTEEIMHHYGLSFQQAGYAKKTGDLPEDYLPEVLNPFRELLVQQVHRSLQFFYSLGSYTEVDKIVLAGGCASISGIAALLEERLGTPTLIADPLANMLISPAVNATALANDTPTLLTATGLALRGTEHAKY